MSIQKTLSPRGKRRSSKLIRSDPSFSCPSIQCHFSQADSQTDKVSLPENIKTKTPISETNSEKGILWQEDYNIVMGTYASLPHYFVPLSQSIEQLSRQLTEFTTAEVLFKSSAPLWSSKRLPPLHQTYCQSIMNLSGEEKYKYSLIEQGCDKFLAIQAGKNYGNLKLIQIEPLALEYIKNRRSFLEQLHKRCQIQDSQLSELASEIVFLSHQYHKIKKHIAQKIHCIESLEGVNDDAEELLANLVRQLRMMRRAMRRI